MARFLDKQLPPYVRVANTIKPYYDNALKITNYFSEYKNNPTSSAEVVENLGISDIANYSDKLVGKNIQHNIQNGLSPSIARANLSGYTQADIIPYGKVYPTPISGSYYGIKFKKVTDGLSNYPSGAKWYFVSPEDYFSWITISQADHNLNRYDDYTTRYLSADISIHKGTVLSNGRIQLDNVSGVPLGNIRIVETGTVWQYEADLVPPQFLNTLVGKAPMFTTGMIPMCGVKLKLKDRGGECSVIILQKDTTFTPPAGSKTMMDNIDKVLKVSVYETTK